MISKNWNPLKDPNPFELREYFEEARQEIVGYKNTICSKNITHPKEFLDYTSEVDDSFLQEDTFFERFIRYIIGLDDNDGVYQDWWLERSELVLLFIYRIPDEKKMRLYIEMFVSQYLLFIRKKHFNNHFLYEKDKQEPLFKSDESRKRKRNSRTEKEEFDETVEFIVNDKQNKMNWFCYGNSTILSKLNFNLYNVVHLVAFCEFCFTGFPQGMITDVLIQSVYTWIKHNSDSDIGFVLQPLLLFAWMEANNPKFLESVGLGNRSSRWNMVGCDVIDALYFNTKTNGTFVAEETRQLILFKSKPCCTDPEMKSYFHENKK